MHVKSALFSTDNSRTPRLSIFYRISNDKIFIPKYFDNALTDFTQNTGTSRQLITEGKSSHEQFWKNRAQCLRNTAASKKVRASFHCYDNSDVIANLIMTNFHLYLIQLRWQFFQIFVYGNVVYARTWEVLTLKNCILCIGPP